jgi:type IV secretory pathway TraG/TraD family ATPase VirD4
MPLSFTFQSMSQVQRVGEAFKGELDDNLPTKIVFRVMGLSTSGFAVELLGDFETRELSSSEMGNRDGSSMRHERKDRISVRELRELSPGEAYVSTLLFKPNRQVVNPLYRVQFPDTELDHSIEAQLPEARECIEGEGLGLWSKYMSPSRLRDIQRQVHQEMLEAAEVAV